ncbi:ABC transporter permease [Sutcliffiella cohnii]|uniref:ABC transporter permease n=1 Tax=Sutcliffiella cohnii TaxID=33932 RepID=UPI002E1A5E7C|nr:ABC transporter permease [Sutcliffiella cohnii]
MIKTLLKKDMIQVIRDKKEVTLLLFMPFLLITILGFALGAVMNESEEVLNVKVAVVDNGDMEAEKEELLTILKEEGFPTSAVDTMITTAESLSIQDMLVYEVFESTTIFKVIMMEDEKEALDSSQFSAVLSFPKGYRLATWKNIFLNEEDTLPLLSLSLNNAKGLEATVVSNVVESYMEQFQLNTIIGKEFAETGAFQTISIPNIEGEVVTLKGSQPISSFEYYAVGMSVMFVLYVASFVAAYALYEKQQFVFHRILLSNVSPSFYIFSKWLTGTVLSFIQLCILFGLSSLIYGVHWDNIILFLIVTLCISFVVGSFSVLFTTLNFRFNTERASSLFSNLIVTILALVGGSFISWKAISETLWKIGGFTPNGAALKAYLAVMQENSQWADIQLYVVVLLITAIGLSLLALIFFPKRSVA